ncbi:MAG TPA: ABC transporter permease [Candidatus Acidoferrales bacterium]|nr:ABC transporter permease [Candidatus Acidoferrales bacterium]
MTSAAQAATAKTPQHLLPPRPVVRVSPPSAWWAIPFREIWEYRELLYFLVWRDVKVRYKQTVIGIAWAVLQPVLTMGVFWLFLGKLAQLPSDGLPYAVFYFGGLVPWTYFAYSLNTATNTVVNHQNLLTKVYFPRLVLPISAVLSGLVDFAVGFILLILVTLGYHIVPGLSILWLPLLLLLAVCTALGVGLWFSALNALYRDVRYIMAFVVQFWMFASPVMYPSSMVSKKWPHWAWLYGLNPMTGVIDGFRWALTGRGQPPGLLLLASAVMVLILLIGGLMFFSRMEGTVADLV